MRRKKMLIAIVFVLCAALLWGCSQPSIEDAVADIPRPTEKAPNPETKPQSEAPEETEPPQEIEAPTEAEPVQESEPISANYADDMLLSSGNYHYFAEDSSEYAIAVAFRANETLTDVALYELYWNDEGLVVGPCLYSLGRLDPEKPLVVDMDFPGDLSSYEIRFADARGVKQSRVIYMSGMDGSLILSHE